jgi:hypothetical protein
MSLEQHVKVDEICAHREILPDGRVSLRYLALCDTPDRREAFAGTVWCEAHGRVEVRNPPERKEA